MLKKRPFSNRATKREIKLKFEETMKETSENLL